jgi:hypothetical protein
MKRSLGLAVVLAIALIAVVLTRQTKEGLSAGECGVSKAKGHEGASLKAGSHCCPDWTYAQKNHCETADGCKVHKDGQVYDCKIKPKRVGKTLYTSKYCARGQRIYAKSQASADAWCRRHKHMSPAEAAGIFEGALIGLTIAEQMQQAADAKEKAKEDACMKDRHHAYVKPHDGKPGKCIPYNGSPWGSDFGAVSASSAEVDCLEKKGTLKDGICYTWGYCHYNQEEPIYKNGRVTGCKTKQTDTMPVHTNPRNPGKHCATGMHLVGNRCMPDVS